MRRTRDGKRAAQMLALIGELYAIEREAKDADEATRLALRQERSVPVLAQIKDWLDTEGEVVLPRSPMGLAITVRPEPVGRAQRLRHAGLFEHRQQRQPSGR